MWLPMQYVQVDTLQLVRSKKGFTYLLVVIDQLTGFVFLKPLMTKRAEEVQLQLLDVFSLVGYPAHLKTDGGKEFCNKLLSNLLEKGHVQHHVTIAYDHHSNGVVERANRAVRETINKLMRSLSEGEGVWQERWEELLPWVQFAVNTRVNRVTQATPFALMLGRSPFPASTAGKVNLGESQRSLEKFWELHSQTVPEAVIRMRVGAAGRAKADESVSLKAGDRVMHKTVQDCKGDDRFTGPFTVKEVNDVGHYILAADEGSEVEAPRNLLKRIMIPEAKKSSTHGANRSVPLNSPPVSNLNRVKGSAADDKTSYGIRTHTRTRGKRRNYAAMAPDEIGSADGRDSTYLPENSVLSNRREW